MSTDGLPVVAIVGRPNVGKSTLFNGLTRTRNALVADLPGVTRDRIYGRAELQARPVLLIDTGGLEAAGDDVGTGRERQTRLAVAEADLVVLLTDARAGVVPADAEIAAWLRTLDKPLVHAVNKIDGLDEDAVLAESLTLGIHPYCLISASHRRGLDHLSGVISGGLPKAAEEAEAAPVEGIHLALIGRPNTGKSTLLNRFLGEERALATPVAGTTRDPIHARVERDGQKFHLVDTAGMRRRPGSHEGIERFSTIKAMQAMERAGVVVLMMDSTEGITDQDARLAGHVVEAGRGLVLALNKWDGLGESQRKTVLIEVGERLQFARHAPVVTLSALHGSGLGELTGAVVHVHRRASTDLPTPALTRALRAAVEAHPPPGGKGGSAKLRYAHAGGLFPTRVVIHGNRTAQLPTQYRRYLINAFRRAFDLTGVAVELVLKDSDNPYAGRRNTLTPRQLQKRKRLRSFTRKNRRRG
ncbi:ribosome biogenesis GTPase Der [Wenzhouxiangella limi]|uniref:GTPase Der n=1 Tax=Wenzhouxiangella limi TaxID=2707351 RepID=A0A845UY80_9GAMM|nr:ribosome biogenesis GTPase Der [Wenzhouxiangella limi]NDY94830.1 ribosome biogenesis GTPase Der [Wenzhouxiangella limi]